MTTHTRGLAMRGVANVLIGLMVLAVVAGVAVAVSGDDEGSFTNTALEDQTGASQDEGRPGRPCRGPAGPLRHAIHGELIVPEPPAEGEEPSEDAPKSWQTIVFDAGTVVEASDDQLTLERPDGKKVTVDITDETRMREDAQLDEGDPVRVIADDDGHALGIMTPPDDRAQGQGQGEGEAQGEAQGEGARAERAAMRCGPRPGGMRGGPPEEFEGFSPENVSATF